jgi:hypothetical protein
MTRRTAAAPLSPAPRERPILFSAAMVRALLAGTKRQTRRVVKAEGIADAVSGHFYPSIGQAQFRRADGRDSLPLRCPFGRPGDKLWCKEAIRRGPRRVDGYDSATFAADGEFTCLDTWPWKRNVLPAIHCPRGLSRLTLVIESVRVERLQDISEEDARAEGVTPDVVLALLAPRAARVRTQPCHWLTGGDENEAADDYCRRCALLRLRERRREEDQPALDGGWETEHDTPPVCVRCGRRLDGRLTQHGAGEEAAHYEAEPFDASPSECLDVVRVLDTEPDAFTARTLFRFLWTVLHGPGSWEANPWVWAISFRREASP